MGLLTRFWFLSLGLAENEWQRTTFILQHQFKTSWNNSRLQKASKISYEYDQLNIFQFINFSTQFFGSINWSFMKTWLKKAMLCKVREQFIFRLFISLNSKNERRITKVSTTWKIILFRLCCCNICSISCPLVDFCFAFHGPGSLQEDESVKWKGFTYKVLRK